MFRKVSLIAGMALFVCSAGLAHASAPAVRAASTDLVDLADAESYFGQGATHTNGLCALSGSACASWRPEAIRALARTLGRDGALSQDEFAQRVADHVRGNIATEFRYGLSKGGFGALIDASGTPFDQAQLMVEVLRAGGATASYQSGAITLTGADFAAWTGITSAQAACRLLADGGIPARINGQYSATCAFSGAVGAVTMAHAWVSAGGKLYDPSFKKRQAKTSVDIASILQCAGGCGAQALTSAIPAGRAGSDAVSSYVQNVDTGGLGAWLNQYARNFQSYVESHAPNASLADVVGGRVLDTTYAPVATSTLPYQAVETKHTWSEIPDQYRSRLAVAFDGVSVSVFADEVAGEWLHIGGVTIGTASTSNYRRRTALFMEREAGSSAPVSAGVQYSNILNNITDTNQFLLLSAADFNATSSYMTITLSVDHPYAGEGGGYADQQITQTQYIDSNINTYNQGPNGQLTPIYVVQAWGDTGRGQVDRMSAIARSKEPLADLRFVSGTAFPYGGTPVLNHVDIPGVIARWLSQSTAAAAIIDSVNQTRTQAHHTLGTVLELPNGAYPISAETSYSTTSVNAVTADRLASVSTMAALVGALEGSVIEQVQDLGSNWSSVALFKLANQKGYRFYDLNAGNIDGFLAAAVNYSADEGAILKSYTGEGYGLIAPQNGDIGALGQADSYYSLSWSPLLGYKADASRTAYVSSEMKGAGAPSPLPANPLPAPPQSAFRPSTSLATGDLTLTLPPDLSVGMGSFPRKLEFQRTYSSAAVDLRYHIDRNTLVNIPVVAGYATSASHLRLGWSHNFEIRATFSNDGDAALGRESAREAANAVAAIQVLRELNLAPTFQSRLTGIFVSSWLVDQTGGNTVIVQSGASADRYMRAPSGEFRAEPGKTGKLIQTGARSEVIDSAGHHFSYYGVGLSLTRGDGSVQTFSSGVSNAPSHSQVWGGNGFRIDRWDFPTGDRLKFTYKVVDNTASTVTGSSLPPLPLLSILTKVENSQGRVLNFETSTDVNNVTDADGYRTEYLVVTDGVGHSVRFRDKTPDFVAGFAAPSSMKVIGPDGAQSRIDYEAPMATMATSSIRIRALYAPTSFTTPRFQFDYDGLRRVSKMTDARNHETRFFPARVAFGLGEARGESLGPSPSPKTELSVGVFNSANNLVINVDPLGAKTTYSVDNAGQVLRVTAPELNQTRMTYDVRGNRTSTCLLPKPTQYPDPAPDRPCVAANGAITTSTVYGTNEGDGVFNCANWVTCNRPTKEVDGLAHATDYEWNGLSGDLKKVIRPADKDNHHPQVEFTYEPMSGSNQSSFSVLKSKVERISESEGTVREVTTSYEYDGENSKFVLKSATVDSGGLNIRTCYHFDAAGNVDRITDPRASTCPVD